MDWAKAVAGIKYSFTLELRDRGAYGFLLPKSQIQGVGEEVLDGIVAAVLEMGKQEGDDLWTNVEEEDDEEEEVDDSGEIGEGDIEGE